MAEIVGCPKCGRKLAIPEEFAGRDVQCPSCSNQFRATAPPPMAQPVGPYEHSGNRESDARWDDETGAAQRRYADGQRPIDIARRDYQPNRASAVLILGILSLVICGPILGPIAWVMGSTDLRQMREGRMDPSGEGLTRAGMVCGIVATAFSILMILVWIAFFALAAGGRGF